MLYLINLEFNSTGSPKLCTDRRTHIQRSLRFPVHTVRDPKSHSHALLSLIPRLSPVPFPSSTQSHSQAVPSLISRLSSVSFPGSPQSHSQALLHLIPRLSPVSFPSSTQSHSQAVPSPIPMLSSHKDDKAAQCIRTKTHTKISRSVTMILPRTELLHIGSPLTLKNFVLFLILYTLRVQQKTPHDTHMSVT